MQPELVYLIRHGETPWNRAGRYQGWRDVPLSARGRRQALRVARYLGRAGIGVVVTSDLRRALATAAPLARRARARLVVDPRLREMGFGRWEGLTFEQVRARYPRELEVYRSNPVETPAGGGESFRQMAERVSEAWQQAIKAAGHRVVAVVAHGAILKALICDLLGLPYAERRRIHLENGSITLFRLAPDVPRLLYLNLVPPALRPARREAGSGRRRLVRTFPRMLRFRPA